MSKNSIYLSLFFLPIIFIAIALGVWQHQRSIWKQKVLEKYQQHIYQKPNEIPSMILKYKGDLSVTGSELFQEFDLKPLFISGKFITDLAFYRPSGDGIELITAFKTPQGVIAVNAGKMPYAARDIPLEKILPQTMVDITGFYRIPETYGANLPRNKALVAKIPFAAFFQKYQDQTLPGALQIDDKKIITPYLKGRSADYFIDNIPNNHIQYMWTWFLLSVIATVIYILLLRKKDS